MRYSLVEVEPVDEDAGTVRVAIEGVTNEDGVPSIDYHVNLSTMDDTATAGIDYVGVDETVIFAVDDFEDFVNNGGQTRYRQTMYFDVAILDDATVEASESFLLRLDTPQGYGEIRYGARETEATISDNDVAGVTVSESTLTIAEGGLDTYTVVLDTQPAGDVKVTVGGHTGTDLTLNQTELTFTTGNWSTAQTVTVTAGQDDDAVDDTATLTHTVSSTGDSAYDSLPADSVAVRITENDSVGVSIDPTRLTIGEGDSDTYTVVLDSEPSAQVTVTISGHSGSDVSLSDTELTFTTGNWDTAQTVTVSAEQDDDAAVDTDVTLTHAVSGASEYAAIADDDIPGVLVKITEDDSAGVSISRTTLTIAEGGSDTYTVVLDTEPSANVTVTISGHTGTDLTLDNTELTFTTGNWSTAQTVTVTAGEDDDATADADVTLTHALSGASEYAAIAADDIPDVEVTITDNDSVGVTISRTTLTIGEGESDTYTVMLNTEPSAQVTVTISGHSGTDVSLSGQTLTSDELTFTTGNWRHGADGDGVGGAGR